MHNVSHVEARALLGRSAHLMRFTLLREKLAAGSPHSDNGDDAHEEKISVSLLKPPSEQLGIKVGAFDILYVWSSALDPRHRRSGFLVHATTFVGRSFVQSRNRMQCSVAAVLSLYIDVCFTFLLLCCFILIPLMFFLRWSTAGPVDCTEGKVKAGSAKLWRGVPQYEYWWIPCVLYWTFEWCDSVHLHFRCHH